MWSPLRVSITTGLGTGYPDSQQPTQRQPALNPSEFEADTCTRRRARKQEQQQTGSKKFTFFVVSLPLVNWLETSSPIQTQECPKNKTCEKPLVIL